MVTVKLFVAYFVGMCVFMLWTYGAVYLSNTSHWLLGLIAIGALFASVATIATIALLSD